MTAGEKRKFYRNMQYERTSRTIAVLGVHLCALFPPALIAIVAIAALSLLQHHGAGAHHSIPFAFGGLVGLRELQEKRLTAATQANALIPAPGTPWTAELRQKHKALMDEHDGILAQIDDIKRTERTAAALEDLGRIDRRIVEGRIVSVEDRKGAIAEWLRADKRYGRKAFQHMREESRVACEVMNAEYWEAFRAYCLGEATPEQRAIYTGQQPEFRDMGINTSTLGGYFVPQGFVYEIEEALKYYGDMLGVAEIMDTATGQPLPYPTDNDTTVTGEVVGEGAQVGDADINIGHVVYNAYKFSTKMVKVSLELLQDSAFDMEAYIKDKFAIRLGRILNIKFTNGAGTTATPNEPTGLIYSIINNGLSPNAWATQQPYGTPVIAAGSSANDGSGNTGTNSIGYGDLVNLEHAVDPLYRRGAKYMFHDGTLRFLKTLLDKYGRPLWVPGVTADAPDEIAGHEYSINNDMATIAASANTVAFGALKKYLIRRVKEMSVLVLRERFADYGQVALIGFARYDGNLLDAGTHPVSYLQQHS